MTEPQTIWIEQSEAAGHRGRIRPPQALEYLIGEKFLNFLEAAETDADFRAEIPAFVAKIKKFSSDGGWRNMWRRLGRRSRLIQACSSRGGSVRRRGD